MSRLQDRIHHLKSHVRGASLGLAAGDVAPKFYPV